MANTLLIDSTRPLEGPCLPEPRALRIFEAEWSVQAETESAPPSHTFACSRSKDIAMPFVSDIRATGPTQLQQSLAGGGLTTEEL